MKKKESTIHRLIREREKLTKHGKVYLSIHIQITSNYFSDHFDHIKERERKSKVFIQFINK